MHISSPLRVFIVDDDPMMQEMLRDHISKNASFKVSAFSTGEECLKHVNENPDVIILDYYLNSKNLDAANGIEVLKAIKKYHPEIHVIFLSGQGRYGVAMQTIQRGAEHYVIKDDDAFAKIDKILSDIAS
jgi:DNA-binding NarL/FixJ family response regulator